MDGLDEGAARHAPHEVDSGKRIQKFKLTSDGLR